MENAKKRGRPKGLPRTGGRKLGTTNKVTKDLRETISSFLQKNASKMQEEYEKLDPREKLTFFEKLIKYSLPAMTAVDLTTKGEKLSPFERSLEKMTDQELENKLEDLQIRMQ
jgi:hypothetical protein